MACNFCSKPLYIKVVQYLRPVAAPLTRAEELRQELQDLTGELYIQIEHAYCPICGAQLKGESND